MRTTRPPLHILFLAAILLGLVFAAVTVRLDREPAPSEPEPAPEALRGAPDPLTGAVLVDLVDDASDADRAHAASELGRAIAPFDWPTRGEHSLGTLLSEGAQLYRVAAPASEMQDILRQLSDDPEVEGVELERRWSIPTSEARLGFANDGSRAPVARDSEGFKPNDPYYQFQWHLDQIGMPEAWTRARGQGAVVAVIDTGVAYRSASGFTQAPDLNQTSFVEGWDFVDEDAYPDDEHGHGTHVAGTIAQSTDNALGVAGVAPEASIMPLRVLDRYGSGSWGAIASAIRWAADHGAHVINMSLGGGYPSSAVQRAIDYAHEKGVLVVAAAGNASHDEVEYPARHRHVVAVGAVRFDRQLSFYSSYGEGLDLVAPGGDLNEDQNHDGVPDGVIQNTLVNGDPNRFDYLAWQGTSMAAPHVAGVAALLYQVGVRDPDTAEELLTSTAEDLGDSRRFAAGLVRAPEAVQRASRGLGAGRGLAALAFGLLALLALRRRKILGVALAPTLGVAFLLAGGAALLPWSLLPGGACLAGLSAGPIVGLAQWAGPYAGWLVLSALLPFGLAALFLQKDRLRPLLVGLSLGMGAFLLVEALVPTLHLGLLSGPVAGLWLLLQAGLCFGLGALIAKRAR